MGLIQKIITPNDFINALLSKKSVNKSEFENFKGLLNSLKSVNKNESEEHQKTAIRDFLTKTYSYSINTKDNIDWAIFKDSKPAVIVEVKKIDNKSEMVTQSDIAKKAFFESILYFMIERNSSNDTIKHIIITNLESWFIYDAKDFEKLFWEDKVFKKRFLEWQKGEILNSKTEYFYNDIAKPFCQSIVSEIECGYFEIEEQSEKNLITIYKILHRDSLLKEFNPNDANSLNREFYAELLYILGLEEVKEGSKKLIQRAKNPQSGSFYENIAEKLNHYGKPNDFESIIKLMIIWINRILFLKLLESQIVKWNKNRELKFLNAKKIEDFDRLEMLFFDILAKKPNERTHKEFDYIPYLNSSLFEIHAYEEKSLKVSNLADDAKIPYYTKTVIKDQNGAKKSTESKTLHYLFEFLDAYDFGVESGEEIVSENRALINASVLGLIFEKLNGYKDGSFYTPSFITSYMARESIHKAILQKFKDSYEIECENIASLNAELIRRKIKIEEIEKIVDTLTICDPAVGSGHFLVSALNEIIYAKSLLGIIPHRNEIEVINDDLIIKDFEYTKANNHPLQKYLFIQKKKIIESSLFGVDINPNSVNICRLRLWIELLKNAYYQEDGTLETLPNIDINIKEGNSLISRFDLKDELKIKNIKHEIENYKSRVRDYKENLGTKKEVLESIRSLKEKFKLTLKAEWKVQKNLESKLKEFVSEFGFDGLNDNLLLIAIKNRYGQTKSLFGDEADEKKKAKMLKELELLESQIEEIERGKIYENAFEWRFEFPEVLDEEGNFVGFDVVIGNPPYISLSKLKEIDYSRFGYEVYDKSGDILALFIEKGLSVLDKSANLSFIVSNSWLKTKYGESIKRVLEKNKIDSLVINFEDSQIFDEATVESCIVNLTLGENAKTQTINIKNFTAKNATPKTLEEYIALNADGSNGESQLMQKIASKGKLLKEWNINIYRGVLTGFNEAFIIDTAKKEELVTKDPKSSEMLKPLIRGRDVKKYSIEWDGKWLINSHNNPPVEIENYPAIKEHLDSHFEALQKRQDKGKTPYNLRNCAYLDDFEKPKIVWAELSDTQKFSYDESGIYPDKTVFFMRGENLKYLLAVLNSKLVFWYFGKIAATTGMGATMWQKAKLELLPIPICENEQPFITLVDKILEAKKENPQADTKELESEIDKMVYELYGLSEEEIRIIEGKENDNNQN